MEMKNRVLSGTTNNSISEREKRNRALARKAAAEGIVLLKNEDNILPLSKSKPVALYGSGALKTVKGGTGSGDVNERDSVSIFRGMENAGFKITSRAWLEAYEKTYEEARLCWRREVLNKAKSFDADSFFYAYSGTPFRIPAGGRIAGDNRTETAIYVISRTAGEGIDREETPGDYYLSKAERTA